MLKDTFAELGLSESCYRVYATLLEYGPSSAKQISERLELNRPSTYDYLKALTNKGLVMERFEDAKNLFQVDDPKQVTRLLDERIEQLAVQRKQVALEIPALMKHADSVDPTFKFYTGKEGVRQALNQIVYSGETDSIAMWSIEDVVNLLGGPEMVDIVKKRVQNKVYVRGIWSYTDNLEDMNRKFNPTVAEESLREVRMAPKEMQNLSMGYWLAGNTVAFVSSKREAFGFVLRSRDFADFLRSQFEMVWQASTLIVKD
ncbi:MAG: helix-turn-helix domain-containing protein [Patescibacteria group bacterium]